MNLYTPVKGPMLQAYCIEHKVKPMPRPRVHNNRVYVPDTTSELAELLNLKRFGACLNMPLLIDVHLHFRAPKKEQMFATSHLIGDEDNLRKTVNDALVKAQIIEDDRLVLGGETSKMYSSTDYVWIFIYAVRNEIAVRKITHEARI